MKRHTAIKLAFAVAGLLVWGYGQRVDDATIRWVGIALLAAAVLLRFLPKRLRKDDYPET
jgi:hypothetical protein